MSLGTIPPANGRVILMGCREARNVLRDKLAERRLAAQMRRWEVAVEDEAPEPMEVVDHGGDWLAPVFDEREILRKREEEWAAGVAARDKARAAAAAAGTAAAAEGAAGAVGSALADEPLMPVNWDEPDELGESVGSRPGPDFFCAEGEKPVESKEWTAETRREQPLEDRGEVLVEPDPLWVPDSSAKFRDLKKNWDNALNRRERESTDMYLPRAGETREEYNEALVRPYEAYFEGKVDGGR